MKEKTLRNGTPNIQGYWECAHIPTSALTLATASKPYWKVSSVCFKAKRLMTRTVINTFCQRGESKSLANSQIRRNY